MSTVPHPIAGVPGVTDAVTFVKSSSIKKLPVPWPRCQELQGSDIAAPTKGDLTIAVSHAWPYQVHPDPLGEKVDMIDQLVQKAIAEKKPSGGTLLFYDLLSVPQRPFRSDQRARSKEEDEKFAIGLKTFPTIYLMADATVHLDADLSPVSTDGNIYTVPLEMLEDVSLMQLGPAVQVVASSTPECQAFDFLLKVNGTPVKSVNDVDHALGRTDKAPGQSTWKVPLCMCRCNKSALGQAQLQTAQYGKRNTLSPNVKGWIYLERFASMVKIAMTHKSQIGGLVFTNSEIIREQLYLGGERLREAAANGTLKEELARFAAELGEKQFSAASIDKQMNTGGKGGLTTDQINATAYSASDRDVVWSLMQEMVEYLAVHWVKEQQAQEHRQLVLAVNRQDVEALDNILSSRADPNIQDKRGGTVLHEAAVMHNADLISVLLRHAAGTLIQDTMGAIPAHRVFLRMECNSEGCFRLLAPSRRELEVRNQAGVTALQRFHDWCALAKGNGEAYAPAMAVVEELRERHPDLQLEMDAGGFAEDCGAVEGLKEGKMDCSVGGRKVEVQTWEHAAGVEHHVVFFAMCPWIPLGGHLRGAKSVAQRIAAKYPVKVHVISRMAFDVALYKDKVGDPPYEALISNIVDLIEAMHLNDKFVLLDDSGGDLTVLLWRLHARERLAGALVLNIYFYFDEGFPDSDMCGKVAGLRNFFLDKLSKRDMDFYRTNQLSNMCLQSGPKMFKANQALFQSDFDDAPSDAVDMFFNWGTFACSWDPMLIARILAKAGGQLADKLPIVVAVSDQAPDFFVLDSTLRLQNQLGVETLEYIPSSKGGWMYEGERQRNKIISLSSDVIERAFNIQP